MFYTLTLQNILPGKAEGSKKRQMRSQKLLVCPLVSTPINKSLSPVRDRYTEYFIKLFLHQSLLSLKIPGTHCEDCDGLSQIFAQQVVQLLLGEGAYYKTKDKEKRQENA